MKHARNQPCKCGSGKKFKACCLRKPLEKPSLPPRSEMAKLRTLAMLAAIKGSTASW